MTEVAGRQLKKRVRAANYIIETIGSCGPRLLYSPADERYAAFGLDWVEQVWLVDDLTGAMLYPFGDGPWRGFSDKPGKRALVALLANFIKDDAALDGDMLAALLEGYGDNDKDSVRAVVADTLRQMRDSNAK